MLVCLVKILEIFLCKKTLVGEKIAHCYGHCPKIVTVEINREIQRIWIQQAKSNFSEKNPSKNLRYCYK
jgi:hypothetical protein